MEYGQFFPDMFVTSNVMNQQTTNAQGNFQDLALGRGLPGLIAPNTVSYSVSGLNLTATLNLPFQVLFGTGLLAQAHGTINGADTQTYTASFSGVVPAPGGAPVQAYLACTYQQIQQNPVIFIGPPQGHPDFNPNFQPYTAYTQIVDSINVFATTTVPDNTSSFELFRCTLTSGSTGIGTINTAFQEWASSLSDMPVALLQAPGTLFTQVMNNILVGGTYTMPNATAFNSNLLSITCNTASLVNVNSPNNIYGYFGQGASAITTFNLPQGGTIEFEAINGTWQIIGGNPLGMGIPVLTFPITVPEGGTGQVTLPAHTVLLGEGTTAIGNAGPGNIGIPLVGQGASSDPIFGAINLNSGAVTNVLQLGNGGTNATSYAPFSVICLNSNTGGFTGEAPAGVGSALVSNGTGALPSFQPINLNEGPTSITGILPVVFGGTANNSFTPYGVVLATAAGNQLFAEGPGNIGWAFISNGNGAYPSFGQINLASNAVTSILQTANGGTANNSFAPYGVVLATAAGNQLFSEGPGTAGYALVSNGPGAYPTFQPVAEQLLISEQYYGSAGTYVIGAPSWATYMAAWVWGAGGGGSGTTNDGQPQHNGASGAGGGCASTFGINITGGESITIVVGAGGAGASSGAQAGTGGASALTGSGFNLLANGGSGANSGPGPGGTASGGTINIQGQDGVDLDGFDWPAVSNAIGGNAAFGGGNGGNYQGGGQQPAGNPGGGGGANFSVTSGQNGADGGVRIIFFGL